MSQQVPIERRLVFKGKAALSGNIEGRPSNLSVVHYDDFLGKAIDATYDYTVDVSVNSATVAITVPHMLTLTTGGADDDDVDFAMGVEWYGQFNACLEARFRVDDVDATGANIGFADATGYSADNIAMEYLGTALTSTAVEFAGFMHDSDASTSNLYGVSVKSNANGDVINSGSAPTDGKIYTVRVVLIDRPKATVARTDAAFYVNTAGREIDPINDLIGIEIDAVTRTTALCPYIGLINREASTNTLDVDYIKIWQDRR